MKSQVSTLIHRPLAEVFRFVANFENQSQWQAATIQNTQITPGPMRVGAQGRHVGKWLGRNYESIGEVVEYEPDREWGYKSVSGPYDLVMHYHFESVGDDTRLTMDVEGETKGFFGFFKFMEPLVARAGEKLLKDDLIRLKKVMENER
ncbi:MAG: SRPBCC family protein [Caldilineales bacterium]|nr:SRPBCC family protein [Caldilineales bacterium]